MRVIPPDRSVNVKSGQAWRIAAAAVNPALESVALGGLVLLLSLAGGMARAGLRDSPPAGLVPGGSWLLDAARSDDAEGVIDRAREALIDNRGTPGTTRGAGRFGGEGGFPTGGGGMTRGGVGGAGFGGGGSWGHNATPAADDPLGGGQAESSAGGSGNRTRDAVLEELERNPQTLQFRVKDRELRVFADDTELGCEPGGPITLSDRLGDAERRCGWDGRAWIVETKRSGSGTRVDRYEWSRDGKRLTYTTIVSGEGMPRFKLTRVYQAGPAR